MQGKKSNAFVYSMKCTICVLFVFAFGYMESFDVLQPFGIRILGIFIGMLFGC